MGKVRKVAEAVNKVDRKATHRAATLRDNPVIKVLGGISEAADQPPLIALSVGTALLGAVLRKPVMVRCGARMLVAELIATGIKTAVKRTMDRTRPAKAIGQGEHRFARGNSDEHDETSFPSGHTAGAVAVARAIAQEVPGAALPVYVIATAVGAVQMPRGKHYVLDTVAGAAIGYLADVGAGLVLRSGARMSGKGGRLVMSGTSKPVVPKHELTGGSTEQLDPRDTAANSALGAFPGRSPLGGPRNTSVAT